ncbi:MAG: PilZ domain-containing protein [Nitrospirae bacterium]|nr:PilZ domain-containing protein [Nitrospirota bacterium]
MDINGKMLFTSEVKPIDVSIGGICLKADRRFEIGREYTLKLEYDDKILSVNGSVVWSVLSGWAGDCM